MDAIEFSRCAYKSATAYLNYLKSSNKGKDVIHVTKIALKNNRFVLSLDKRSPYPDALVMKIDSPMFPQNLKGIINVVYFTEKPASVTIKVSAEYFEKFKELEPSLITFESDFCFLVEAVRKWYKEHHKKIQKPSFTEISYCIDAASNGTTDSQLNAIDTALTSDVSYIWGAPGTGKTQYVLSNCIMEYVKQGRKVILMAPTNNALEQSLRGVIKVFEKNGLLTSTIIRLGHPTLNFAKEHPEVCLSIASDFKIKSLKDEIEELVEENRAQVEYLNIEANFEKFKALEKEWNDLEPKHIELFEEKYEKNKGIEKIKVYIEFLSKCIGSWEKLHATHNKHINFLNEFSNYCVEQIDYIGEDVLKESSSCFDIVPISIADVQKTIDDIAKIDIRLNEETVNLIFDNAKVLSEKCTIVKEELHSLMREKSQRFQEKSDREAKISDLKAFSAAFLEKISALLQDIKRFDICNLENQYSKTVSKKTKEIICSTETFASEHNANLKTICVSLKRIDDLYSSIESAAKKLKKQQNECIKEKELYKSKLSSLKNSLDDSNKRYQCLLEEQNSFIGRIKSFFSKKHKNSIEKEIYEVLEESSRTNEEIDSTLLKIQKLGWQYKDIDVSIDNTQKELDKLFVEANQTGATLNHIIEGLLLQQEKSLNEASVSYTEVVERVKNKFEEIKEFHKNFGTFYTEIENLFENSMLEQEQTLEKLEGQIQKIDRDIDSLEVMFKNIANKAFSLSPSLEIKQFEDIRKAFEKYFLEHQNIVINENLIKTIEKKKDELAYYENEQAIEIGDRFVVACTVDYAFLHFGEFPQNIDENAEHLFVDEAAYCQMIKAGVFFSYGIPVTLLGDHMQLPPICEMSDENVREDHVTHMFLWAQSSLYFPEVFLEESDIESMYLRFYLNSAVNIESISMASLDITHRFGNNLSRVLDEFVYKFGFSGKTDEDTKIIVINAPKNPSESEPRTNFEEIEAIQKYINKANLLSEEFAILTPYKRQVDALKQNLGYNKYEISTIHASQGREWDTVILSVVDKNNKWYTDTTSTKSNGLKIINTAISRAKKELVLVLDYEHWKYCSLEQLIGNIAVNNTKYLESSAL